MKAPEPVPVLAISPETLAEIEKSLSRHMGPLASVIIKKSRAETTSFDQFFELLAEQIPDAEEQKAFLSKVKALKPARRGPQPEPEPPPAVKTATAKTATGKAMPFSPEVLAQAEKRLASYVGPLAKVLIKDAVGKSSNLKELYSQLATHIDEEDERRDFLAALPR
jgi:serine/threonine-protein kinase